MAVRDVLLALGVALLAAGSAVAGTDDQQKGPVAATPAAQDGFRVCNLSKESVELAKATYSGKRAADEAFVSEGWYQFEPGQCQVLWPGKLQYRYYLVYAQSKQAGREWNGDIPICVGREAFTLRSTVCRSDQYQRLFMQIDTKDGENWTHNLRP